MTKLTPRWFAAGRIAGRMDAGPPLFSEHARSGLTLLVALLVAFPVAAVAWIALTGGIGANWQHLWETVLPGYVMNSVKLAVLVGIGVFLAGTACAWFVTMHDFPAARFFEWALLLPLAMPAYVVAFVYTDLLEYAGPVQGTLRDLFGWQAPRDYWFPEIRSLGGAGFVMTMSFFPYVYLLARTAFLEQSLCALEVSRTLGCTKWDAFRRVALPLAWPSIMVGIMLCLMETLSDFGVVDLFSVQTLTTGLFNVWLVMGDAAGGAQIALVLLVFIAGLVSLERRGRIRRAYYVQTSRMRAPPRRRLPGWRGAGVSLLCFLPFFFGFLLPAIILIRLSGTRFSTVLSLDFAALVGRSVALGGAAALLCVVVAVGLTYSARLGVSRPAALAARAASFGYAIPGAVLAIGVLVPFGFFDRTVNSFMEGVFGVSVGLILSGTVAALLFAYLVRFLTLAHGTVESGLKRVRPSLDMAARTLGRGATGTLRDVHLPLIRGSLLTAILLVFVDVMKELPATLVLRPFNFDTLATTAYSLAADERFAEAALPSLAIALAGLLPVLIISRAITRARDFGAHPETEVLM